MSNNEIIQEVDGEIDASLKLSLKKVGDVADGLILYLVGSITTYNVQRFQNQVFRVIESGYTKLVFHCDELTHISSSGIGSFAAFLKSVKSRGGDLILAEMQPQVRDLFHLLGFAQVFVIKDTLPGALRVFSHISSGEAVLGFPRIFACPVCSKKLKALKQGRFRCSGCKTILAIDNQGRVFLG